MIKNYLCYIMLIFSLQTFSQGEANIWYFGINAGLDFNTNPPTPLTNLNLGGMFSSEGCSTISDSNGNLLFFTNGEKIWNKNFQIMQNGDDLAGHNSSSQSSAIIPYPGTYNFTENRFDKYFVVTLDDYVEDLANDKGVRFSEIDMTIDDGLGGITAQKNIHLFGTITTEKVCVIPHSNGCDYWVVCKVVDSNEFYVYSVTSEGFNTVPIVSETSFFVDARPGQMKASTNNKLISYVVPTSSIYSGFYIFNFDNSTGLITEKFADINSTDNHYGTEFSPNSNIVYKSGGSRVYQYNIDVASNEEFVNSKTILFSSTAGLLSMQLGPDGKIYIARPIITPVSLGIGVINNPNELGENCNFVSEQQDLAGRFCMAGLPNQLNNIKPHNEIIIEDESCSYIQVALQNNSSITDYSWEFSTITNPENILYSSNIENATFIFPNPDETYIVSCLVTSTCYTNKYQLIYTPNNSDYEAPIFTNLTTNICQNQTPNVLPTTSFDGISGTWSPNTIDTSNAGVSIYVFTPNTGECAYPFTLETTVNPSANITFSNASICTGETLNFPDTGSITGTWNPTTISNTTSKTYTFTPNTPCGLASEWFVEVRNEQPINFAQTTICNGEEINFPNTNAIAGIWSPNTVSNTTSTNYTFTPNNNCIEPSTWQVNVVHPATNLSLTTVNNTIIVNTENTNHQLLYQLNNGFTQFSNVFNQVNSGCHTVNVTDSFGCTQLSSTIFVLDYPKFFTPNNDGFNDYWNINLENSNSKLFIFDRYGKLIKQIFPNEIGWNGTYNNKQLPATDYWFVLEYEECGIQKTFKSHFSLLR
jgi:gliding motility-associated-like protein